MVQRARAARQRRAKASSQPRYQRRHTAAALDTRASSVPGPATTVCTSQPLPPSALPPHAPAAAHAHDAGPAAGMQHLRALEANKHSAHARRGERGGPSAPPPLTSLELSWLAPRVFTNHDTSVLGHGVGVTIAEVLLELQDALLLVHHALLLRLSPLLCVELLYLFPYQALHLLLRDVGPLYMLELRRVERAQRARLVVAVSHVGCPRHTAVSTAQQAASVLGQLRLRRTRRRAASARGCAGSPR